MHTAHCSSVAPASLCWWAMLPRFSKGQVILDAQALDTLKEPEF